MARCNDPLIQAALDLAWSHWTGLGVRGVAPLPETAVDPEALVYFTAVVVEHDPRLRDEVADWWRRFQRHVSRPRLTRLGRVFEPEVVARFTALEAHVRGLTRTSGKSRLDRLDHPARTLLRLRCAFGTNARAELLLALLTQWRDSAGATALALSEVGYGKRNVALVLDDLRLAGLVVTASDANRALYRLADADTLRELLNPVPAVSGRWHVRLPIVAAFVELAGRLRGKDPRVQAVEARKLLARHERRVAALGVKPPHDAPAELYWDRLQTWLVEDLLAVVQEPSRRIPRMIEGRGSARTSRS